MGKRVVGGESQGTRERLIGKIDISKPKKGPK